MTAENRDPQRTHLSIAEELTGKVQWIETEKSARVTLTVDQRMQVDEKGLIHGGFTFGLADYAAMVAVNHPFVVLLSANVRFLQPVETGDRLSAHARISAAEGRKRKVWCEVFKQDQQKVLEGEFLCLTLDKHVLGK
jgi:uncharacterized protein (TIGR00369 family)